MPGLLCTVNNKSNGLEQEVDGCSAYSWLVRCLFPRELGWLVAQIKEQLITYHYRLVGSIGVRQGHFCIHMECQGKIRSCITDHLLLRAQLPGTHWTVISEVVRQEDDL